MIVEPLEISSDRSNGWRSFQLVEYCVVDHPRVLKVDRRLAESLGSIDFSRLLRPRKLVKIAASRARRRIVSPSLVSSIMLRNRLLSGAPFSRWSPIFKTSPTPTPTSRSVINVTSRVVTKISNCSGPIR
jgi:hypothetical protein